MINSISDMFFKERTYKEDFILNGIRVMKKYLLSSIENHSSKNFTLDFNAWKNC